MQATICRIVIVNQPPMYSHIYKKNINSSSSNELNKTNTKTATILQEEKKKFEIENIKCTLVQLQIELVQFICQM